MKNIIILILILLGIDSHINAQDPKEIKVIAIYGDTQDNTAIHQKIAKHILSYHPQLVIHTGDEVNRGNKQKQWTSFNNIISDLMKSALYFPVPGNHENEAKLYYSNFNLPEPRKWYFYQNKNLLFLFINSNLDFKKSSPQYAYFSKILEEKSKTASYVIAIFHHPPFTTGSRQKKFSQLRKTLVPLFEKYHISAVFNGHIHAFEHSVVKSIDYVITGGGGGPLHPQRFDSPYSKKYYAGYNFCILTISADKILVNVYDEKNHPIYNFEILARKLN